MYSYDVIYLQHRRLVEVVFYLKEKKNVFFKNRACKNLKALLCHTTIKFFTKPIVPYSNSNEFSHFKEPFTATVEQIPAKIRICNQLQVNL